MKTKRDYIDQEEFFSLDFFVNRNVLRPRNETEIMVYQILKAITSPETSYIDVGTGSGCILTSVIKNLPFQLSNHYALDLSPEALEVAKINFKHHKISPIVLKSNLLSYWLDLRKITNHAQQVFRFNKNLVISANLPYIKNGDFENISPDVIANEPHIALFGGPQTGFELYERLLEEVEVFMKDFKILKTTLFLEIGFDQYEYSKAFLTKKGLKFEYFRDFGNIWRIIKVEIHSKYL